MVQDVLRVAAVCQVKSPPPVTMSMEPATACPDTQGLHVNQVQ